MRDGFNFYFNQTLTTMLYYSLDILKFQKFVFFLPIPQGNTLLNLPNNFANLSRLKIHQPYILSRQ